MKVRATLVLGERDLMTPVKAGKTLAAALEHSRTVVLRGAGHMIMVEQPDAVLAALRGDWTELRIEGASFKNIENNPMQSKKRVFVWASQLLVVGRVGAICGRPCR